MLLRSALASAVICATAAAQLGPMYPPAQNPQTPEKIMLGKVLFWEEQLSDDNSIACGSCHLPEFGGGDGRTAQQIAPGMDGVLGTADDIRGSGGIVRQANNKSFTPSSVFGLRPQITARTSPSNLGAGHHADLFWD